MNFASAKNPGGGFLGGSQAQEESLARSSSLYPSLLRQPDYYRINKQSPDTFYANNLIYSRDVVFFKDDDGVPLSAFVKADVITMPAVNKSALKQTDTATNNKISEVMIKRIRYVLAVSEQHKIHTLILGAWGCGVFRNDPEEVAGCFRKVLEESPKFDIPEIIFAVIGNESTLRPFQRLIENK